MTWQGEVKSQITTFFSVRVVSAKNVNSQFVKSVTCCETGTPSTQSSLVAGWKEFELPSALSCWRRTTDIYWSELHYSLTGKSIYYLQLKKTNVACGMWSHFHISWTKLASCCRDAKFWVQQFLLCRVDHAGLATLKAHLVKEHVLTGFIPV